MTKYRGWEYEVRPIRRGFWTYDLYARKGGPAMAAIGEVHGDERAARTSARQAIDYEIAEEN